MTERHVVLLCADYPPSLEVAARRMRALAEAVAGAGLRVCVISGFGDSNPGQETELAPGIVALPIPPPGTPVVDALVRFKRRLGRLFIRRAAAVQGEGAAPVGRPGVLANLVVATRIPDIYGSWSRAAERAIAKFAASHSIAMVIVSCPPYSIARGGLHAARRLGVPCLVDLRDPLASSNKRFYRSGLLRQLIEQPVERRIVGRANVVTCVSAAFADYLRHKYPRQADRIVHLPNGYDGEPAKPMAETGHRLTIVFAGAIYANRSAGTLVHAFGRLLADAGTDPSLVSMRFIGARPSLEWARLRQQIADSGCAQAVTVMDLMGHRELAAELARATVLVNLAQAQPLQVPAKTYEHLASGRELLAVCERDSDTGQILAGLDGVHVVEPDDFAGMLSVLRDLYQRHVVQGRLSTPTIGQLRQFSRAQQGERFTELVRGLERAQD